MNLSKSVPCSFLMAKMAYSSYRIHDLIVFVDVVHIREVFTNLFNKAVKYSDGGGQIIICSEHVDDQVKICVSDEGIGISDEQMKY